SVSSDLKEQIVKWYMEDEPEYSMCNVANLAGVSLGLVHKTVSLHNEYSQVTNPFSRRTGRPRTMNEGDIAYVQEILRANPTLYLDEIQSKLASVWNMHVSLSLIGRVLVNLQLTRKKLSKEAWECDDQLRMIWETEMAQYPDPQVFIALDES
ncbi:hypothetical protein GGX14DRAFT_304980, partial [Mycena pura]